MFERYTDRARRVVVLSQEEARRLGHDYIGTEHLLLGLIGEKTGTAGQALQALGVELDAARAQVEQIIGPGDPAHPPSGHMPFTPRTKSLLEMPPHEAAQLGRDYVGTERLLLALLREGDGVGAQILARAGIDVARAGQEIAQLMPSTPKAAGSDDVIRRLASFAARLTAIEQRLSESAGEAGG